MKTKLFIFLTFFSLIIVGCVKHDTPEMDLTYPPVIVTDSVTCNSTTFATVYGTVVDLGNPLLTTCGVCFDTIATPTTADSIKTIIPDEGVQFNCLLYGLTPNTKYYVRTFATSDLGTTYGQEYTFRTYPPDKK